LYTDGVIEAGRPSEKFGNEGLARMLKQSADSPVAEQIALVMDDVARRNADSSPDDATIVVLEFSSARGS
jgi:serine phosphatase RsbU (regulator of sigma subunit)